MAVNPPIAVLIPTYNRVKFLNGCIRNVLSQTYKNYIIIIYDDGSTDNSINAYESYISDNRVFYYKGRVNNGIVFARNQLLNLAATHKVEFACWQDSDDLSNNYRLEMQYNFLHDSKQPMVLTGWTPFHDSAPVDVNSTPLPASNNEIIFASALFKLDSVPQFREIIREPTPTTLGGEDVVWRNELIEKYGQPPELRKQLYHVRRHPDRISVWRRNRNNNPDWYKRMESRIRKS